MSNLHDEKGKVKAPFSRDLKENKKIMEDLFKDCSDYLGREFPVGVNQKVNVYVAYIDGMVNKAVIGDFIIRPLMQFSRMAPPTPEKMKSSIYDWIINGSITSVEMKEVESMDEVAKAVLSGETAVFIDGYSKVIIVSSRGWAARGIQTPDTESVVRGPKEGFNETIRMNTALIRRRIRDTRLKFKSVEIGRRSRSDIAMAYIEGIVKTSLLKEVEERLKNIDIDGILESGYIEQFIEENWWTPFPQMETTQRPDKVAAALLEGKVAILVDNTPFVIILPVTMNSFFQATEDYYERWAIMSFIRIIRYIAGFISIALPGLYIAVTAFHPAMIPTDLVLALAATRIAVPFPVVVEVLIMELGFELLREAGTRLPGPIGSTIGIVGGLIIGQAAVTAGVVSPIIVIIVASTAIASFAIPNYSLTIGFRIYKFLVIMTSAVAGLYGWILGIIIGVIHLTGLKSFGVSYLSPFVNSEISNYEELKDSVIRAPLFTMRKRPFTALDKTRMNVKRK